MDKLCIFSLTICLSLSLSLSLFLSRLSLAHGHIGPPPSPPLPLTLRLLHILVQGCPVKVIEKMLCRFEGADERLEMSREDEAAEDVEDALRRRRGG